MFLRAKISRLVAFVLLVFLGGLITSALPAHAAATSWVGDANASARLITAVQATGSAGQIDVALQIQLAPGWHAYWHSPGDAGIPPSIDWSGSQNVQSAQLYWPAPKRFLLDGLITQGYENGVVLPIAVALDQPDQPLVLHTLVHYAACKDICVPYTALFTLQLPTGIALPGPEAPLISQAWTTIPGSLFNAGISLSSVIISKEPSSVAGLILSVVLDTGRTVLSKPDLFVEGIPAATPAAPHIQFDPQNHRAVLSILLTRQTPTAMASTPLQFTFENGAQAASFTATPTIGPLPRMSTESNDALILLIALLGGSILNVMPCVLPVLSLKLFSLAQARGNERTQFRLNFLATAAGVISSFIVIAFVLVFLKAAGAAIGWGIQFQQPWFLGLMAVLTTLFAASLWEWLPITMPGFAGQAVNTSKSHHPRVTAFITGALATILATSCTAPFVGTAVGFALARDPLTIFGIFLALGIGMAFPYLAVAAVPWLLRFMPKPGAWMINVRIILGFALLATSIWLISIITAVVSPHAALIAGGLLSAILLLLLIRHRCNVSRVIFRRMMAAFTIGLAITATIMPSLMQQAIVKLGQADTAPSTIWQPFDPARIAGLIGQHKLVFVDVTAAWCLVCKVNALAVLDRDPVATQLRASNVVTMRADWTRPSVIITAYLESFHRYGVPLDVIYGPGAPSGIVLPSLLTSGLVMQEFQRAAAPPSKQNQAEVTK
ncbi:MAG: protein-disulfide reductase [Acidiphilium sp. 20-67-58]|nr:MAG: protein-disulfide reductase [Acidiphilium sp. 20-67-58]